MGDERRVLYAAGRWTVEARPTDRGCVKVSVWREGEAWIWGEYGTLAPTKEGWPHPRWWQRSVERALRWGIRLADKKHRQDQEAVWALEDATRSLDSLTTTAEALAALEAEMAR